MADEIKFVPLFDRLLVHPAKETVSSGGIIIPENASEQITFGTVVAVGHGNLDTNGVHIPLVIKKGQKICYGKYAGSELSIGGITFLVMRQAEIWGTIEE